MEKVWQEINVALEGKIKELQAKVASSNTIPQIDMGNILNDDVDPSLIEEFKSSGALIVRSVVPKEIINKLYLEFKG